MAAKNYNMSIFDHYILRKFYRLVKNYTQHLLRSKEEQVEEKVDKIDSRTSRSKLLRREWSKTIRGIREWNASRVKKEVEGLVKRAQGSRTDAKQVREDLDDFLTLSRYKYLEAIKDVNLEEMDIGPPNLESFLSFYLEKLLQDDMVTSRQFLNASVSDRTAVIRSCLTDAVEDSIPSSIHRAILSKKSRRKRKKQQVIESSSTKEEEEEDQKTSRDASPKKEKTKAVMAPPKESKPPSKRSRRVKEVVLESSKETSDEKDNEKGDDDGHDDNEPSQMDVLRERLAALEERDRKLRAGTYKASGKNHDFELNTNLSSFM